MKFRVLRVLEVSIVFCMSLLAIGLYHTQKGNVTPSLVLKTEEATIVQGAYFDSLGYVESYRGKGELVLPMIETNTLGKQIAVYRFITQKGTIEKVLSITVVKDEQY